MEKISIIYITCIPLSTTCILYAQYKQRVYLLRMIKLYFSEIYKRKPNNLFFAVPVYLVHSRLHQTLLGPLM